MTEEREKRCADSKEVDWGAFGTLEEAAAALYDLLERCGLVDLILK